MIHEKHKEWLTARGLDPVLAEKLGIETTRDGTGYWLTVPYVQAGEPVNHKYRQTAEKRHRMDSGAPLSLWNVDCLSEAKDAPVIITEGEWDALAAMQAGFRFVVSVPNGAPATTTNEPESAKRYEWVWRHLHQLDQVKTFILATDGDEAGANLAADLASLLGADRCRFVDYPFPSKDLNEVLVEHGPERLCQLINEAKPYPIKGLYSLSDFPERGEIRSYAVGVDPINEYLRIVPGTLTVVTGYVTLYFNESSQIPWGSIETAMSRLAQKCELAPEIAQATGRTHLALKAYYDCNPPSKLHWSYSLFRAKLKPGTKEALPNPDDYVEMKVNPTDNADNLPAEYFDVLASMSAAKRLRFEAGEWASEVNGALWSLEDRTAPDGRRMPGICEHPRGSPLPPSRRRSPVLPGVAEGPVQLGSSGYHGHRWL